MLRLERMRITDATVRAFHGHPTLQALYVGGERRQLGRERLSSYGVFLHESGKYPR